MLPFERHSTTSAKRFTSFHLFFLAAILVALANSNSYAKTCIFTTKIIASNNPFGSCPVGTDSIIIKDTLVLDVNYEPIMNGVPFEGKLIVDGGVLFWSSNVKFTLGTNARILLFNGGHIYPGGPTDMSCSSLKTIYFDVFKLASCNGVNALPPDALMGTEFVVTLLLPPKKIPDIPTI